jgi:hypothetical protein
MIRTCSINKPGGLLTEDHLGELPMKVRVLDAEMPYLPVVGERDGENDPDGVGINYRAKGLIEVDVMFLRETEQDPTGFIMVEISI